MAEENEVAVETTTETTAETTPAAPQTMEDRLQGFIDEKFAPEPPATEEAAVAEEAEPEVEAAPVEEETKEAEPEAEPAGPSVAMKTLARREGLQDYEIKLARTDEELEELVTHRVEEKRAAERAPVEPAPPFEISLPEEEFPADDPVRTCLNQLHAHYQEKLSVLEQAAVTLIQEHREFREESAASKQHAERAWMGEFHSGLDEVQSDALGQASALTDELNDVREAVFKSAVRWAEKNPSHTLSPKELAQQAARRLGLAATPEATANKEAVREMSGKVRDQKPTKQIKKPMSALERIQRRLNGDLNMKPSRSQFNGEVVKTHDE